MGTKAFDRHRPDVAAVQSGRNPWTRARDWRPSDEGLSVFSVSHGRGSGHLRFMLRFDHLSVCLYLCL